jgi:rhamnosyltransferase
LSLPAVIVTYFPDATFFYNLDAIAAQCIEVVVVDNSSGQDPLDTKAFTNVTVLTQGENIGVAAALNRGLEELERRGYPYAVLFDQDSCPYPDFAIAMEQAATAHMGFSTIGCVYGDVAWDENLDVKDGCVPIKTVITSGSLVAISAWRRLQGFREDLFIDHVDHEFCLRARKSGYDVLLAPKARIHHDIGFPELHSFLGKRVRCSHHAAFRYYYLFRNYLLIFPSLFWTHPKWFVRMGMLLIKMLLKSALFEADKRDKFCFAMKGILHGIQHVSGKLR